MMTWRPYAGMCDFGMREMAGRIAEIPKCRLVAVKRRNFTENYILLPGAHPNRNRGISKRRILRWESFAHHESGFKMIQWRNCVAVSDKANSV